MATIIQRAPPRQPASDVLSGTPRAHPIDRWIFVLTAAWFILIVLVGFIPDSFMRVAAVQTGERPPFPFVMHLHAVLMGAYLLLVLAQTWLMATGRYELHMRLGIAGIILAPALVVVGFILAPTIYHQLWGMLNSAPDGMHAKLVKGISSKENALLLQMRTGVLFSVFTAVGLLARGRNAGLHKRMMLLAPAAALPAAVDRMTWLPTGYPDTLVMVDLFTLLAILPMLAWDVLRNRKVHHAYLIFFAVSLPFAVLIYQVWDTPWWHTTAKAMMGV
jgi:hypothetical protein